MFKATAFACLTAFTLAGSYLCLSPRVASAESWDTTASRPSPWDNNSGNGDNNNNYRAVYDVSPAAAQAAFAQANYERAYSDFVGSANRARAQFNASNDYRQALKAVDDAQADYEAALLPVLESVHSQPAYAALIEKRTRVEAALKADYLLPRERTALAGSKMEYSAKAGRMEADAINSDPAVRQAKAKLREAREALGDRKAQFEVAIYGYPEVVSAKHAFDAAKANLAAAQAFLQGAMLARADTVDADIRRNPVPINYAWGSCPIEQYPVGYYGLGNGYYGANLRVTHFNQQ